VETYTEKISELIDRRAATVAEPRPLRFTF
jgi:hypothetical protein